MRPEPFPRGWLNAAWTKEFQRLHFFNRKQERDVAVSLPELCFEDVHALMMYGEVHLAIVAPRLMAQVPNDRVTRKYLVDGTVEKAVIGRQDDARVRRKAGGQLLDGLLNLFQRGKRFGRVYAEAVSSGVNDVRVQARNSARSP